jgi:uncharacterized protein (DUF58 family)
MSERPAETQAAAPGAPPPDAAEVVRRLELTLGRRIDGLLHGDHAGRVPGLGSEAGETRLYQPGDDPRRIDWNVTARARDPHVRDAVAERDVESWLVVDLSPSTDFGTARCTKRDVVVAAAGALALLTCRSGDRVGAHVLTHEGVTTFPARSGRMHARALLDAFAGAPRPDPAARPDGPGPDLGDALERLARHTRRRGLAAIVSDFPGDGRWVPALRSVAGRHETLAVEVLDPRELDLPDVGLLVVTDPETGDEREVRTDDRGLRERYAAAARARREGIARCLRGRAVDHVVLRTDRDATADLVAWLVRRPRRVAHLRRQQLLGTGHAGRTGRAARGGRP